MGSTDIELDELASLPVEGEELSWEAGYNPLPSIIETASALAWRRFGATNVRIATGDGATWSCTAVDTEGRAVKGAPVSIDVTPEDAVVQWMERVDALAVGNVDHGDAPVSLAEAFPAGLRFNLHDTSAPVIDLASGAIVEVVELSQRAEVA